jgi:hypothetical protein
LIRQTPSPLASGFPTPGADSDLRASSPADLRNKQLCRQRPMKQQPCDANAVARRYRWPWSDLISTNLAAPCASAHALSGPGATKRAYLMHRADSRRSLRQRRLWGLRRVRAGRRFAEGRKRASLCRSPGPRALRQPSGPIEGMTKNLFEVVAPFGLAFLTLVDQSFPTRPHRPPEH